jgi:YVTN family beta-propeller protein
MRLLALLLILLPLPAAASGIAFVINSNDASISLIDVTTQKELRRVPVLREPHHLALSPDGRELLVGDTAGNEMLFLDPGTGNVLRRVPVADPYQLGFSPNGKFLTVTGLARNQVDVYDAATMQLLKRFPLPSMPSHLAYAPDSGMVFVSLQGTNRLVALNLKTMSVAWNEPVGKTPAGVLWHNGRVLVGIMGADYVAVVNPADGQVVGKIHTGRGAHNLFLAPDGKLIYVTNRVDGTIDTLDAKTLAMVHTYKIPGGPDDIDFAPDGRMWVTRRFAQKVAVVNLATGDYDTINVGRSPHGIWLNTHHE